MRKSLALALLLAFPVTAYFHTKLNKADPGIGSTVVTAPTQIRLWFSEEPELALTSVVLERADSSVVAKLVLAATDDKKSIAGKIPAALVPGTYLVVWKTAATDGHPAKGSYWFTYKPKQ